MSAVGLAARTAAAPSRGALVRGLRWLVAFALWSVAGFALALSLAITVPYLQGSRALTVLSGSMEPTISTGDVVVVETIAPTEARISDVITFRDPLRSDALLTHRVREIEIGGGSATFQTKGDANTSVETWSISQGGTIGRVVFRVPKLGYALFWMRGSYGRLALMVIPALVLGCYELWRIWRPARKEPDDETPA